MDRRKKKNTFSTPVKWLKKLSSPVVVGGLQVTDSVIRFIQFKRGKTIQASLRLPPGIIENGKVKQKENFVAALNEIHHRISGNSRKTTYVVLTLPINDVYVQGFSIPRMESDQISETADLNMQVISPIDIKQSYYDWQEAVGEDSSRGQKELLGAFAPKSVLDVFISALRETNFVIASIEFASISLIREIDRKGIVEKRVPYMIINMLTEGLSFIISRNKAPFFHYFHSWKEVQGDKKTIQIKEFETFLKNEMNRILNFYATHWSGQGIKDIIVITPAFSDEIKDVADTEFKGFNVKIFAPNEISIVSGAARRGASVRSGERGISLAGVNVFDIFAQERLLSFIRVWRNIFVTTFGFLLAIFVVTNIYFTNVAAEVAKDQTFVLNKDDSAELDILQSEVNEFNELVSRITEIQLEGYDVSGLTKVIDSLTGGDITLKRVSFNTDSGAVNVNALSVHEEAAKLFISRVGEYPGFINVDLTLSNLSTEEGQISFSFSFEVEGAEF